MKNIFNNFGKNWFTKKSADFLWKDAPQQSWQENLEALRSQGKVEKTHSLLPTQYYGKIERIMEFVQDADARESLNTYLNNQIQEMAKDGLFETYDYIQTYDNLAKELAKITLLSKFSPQELADKINNQLGTLYIDGSLNEALNVSSTHLELDVAVNNKGAEKVYTWNDKNIFSLKEAQAMGLTLEGIKNALLDILEVSDDFKSTLVKVTKADSVPTQATADLNIENKAPAGWVSTSRVQGDSAVFSVDDMNNLVLKEQFPEKSIVDYKGILLYPNGAAVIPAGLSNNWMPEFGATWTLDSKTLIVRHPDGRNFLSEEKKDSSVPGDTSGKESETATQSPTEKYFYKIGKAFLEGAEFKNLPEEIKAVVTVDSDTPGGRIDKGGLMGIVQLQNYLGVTPDGLLGETETRPALKSKIASVIAARNVTPMQMRAVSNIPQANISSPLGVKNTPQKLAQRAPKQKLSEKYKDQILDLEKKDKKFAEQAENAIAYFDENEFQSFFEKGSYRFEKTDKGLLWRKRTADISTLLYSLDQKDTFLKVKNDFVKVAKTDTPAYYADESGQIYSVRGVIKDNLVAVNGKVKYKQDSRDETLVTNDTEEQKFGPLDSSGAGMMFDGK